MTRAMMRVIMIAMTRAMTRAMNARRRPQHNSRRLDARRGAVDLAGKKVYVQHFEREMARQECD